MSNPCVLVKYSVNYADEFDCDGLGIFTLDRWDIIVSNTKKAFKDCNTSIELYFGSNESIEFESFKEWYNCFSVTPITQEEYDTLKQLIFPEYGITLGTCSRIFDVSECVD